MKESFKKFVSIFLIFIVTVGGCTVYRDVTQTDLDREKIAKKLYPSYEIIRVKRKRHIKFASKGDTIIKLYFKKDNSIKIDTFLLSEY